MPIYDLSYQSWQGNPQKGHRFWPIFREAFLYGLRTRWLKFLYAVAWSPALFCSIIIFVRYQIEAAQPGANIETILKTFEKTFYFNFQIAQFLSMVMMVTLIGPGLIGEERRSNALELYLSRPITRFDYLFGKLTALILFLLSVTLLPNLVLWSVDCLMAPNANRISEIWDYPFRTALFSLIASVGTAIFVLAISSMTRSPGMGVLYWVAIFFSSLLAGQVLTQVTQKKVLGLFSYLATYNSVGRAIFDMPSDSGEPPWISALCMIAFLTVLSLWTLIYRLRGSEVFK